MSWSDHFPRLRKKIFRKNKIKTLDICDLSSRISPLNRCFLSAFRLNTAGLAPPQPRGVPPYPQPRGGVPQGGCPQGGDHPGGGAPQEGVPKEGGAHQGGGCPPGKGGTHQGGLPHGRGAHQRGVPIRGGCPTKGFAP